VSKTSLKPLIGVPTGVIGMPPVNYPAHYNAHRYIDSVTEFSNCLAVQIPSMADVYDFEELVERFDGVMLTGGRANIEPHHYGGPPFPDDEPIDPDRDAMVLKLIPACLEADVPMLGICRGLQEFNVALGGSLHYRLHLLEGVDDHRMPRHENVTTEEIYALRHKIALTENGYLADLVGRSEFIVNSLHGQGIARLADGLVVEAVSPDGVIEAVRIEDAKGFAVAVQWHTEYMPELGQHLLSRALFEAFGEATKQRATQRNS
jgi:putative glutamine amidotransferase